MIEVIALIALVSAVANRYAGMDKGDRAVAAIAIGLSFLATAAPLEAVGVAVVYYAWRSIGWYTSLDMGRDKGGLFRDYLVMTAICAVPSAAIWAGTGSYVALTFAMSGPLSYLVSMRLLPYRPGIPHIGVAEVLSGAAFGATMAAAFILQ